MEEIQDQVLTKKERRAERRAERRGEVEQGARIRKTRKIAVLVVIVLLLGFIGWLIFDSIKSSKQREPGTDHSRSFESQGQEHIKIGTPHEAYNSNPPTSGPHYEDPVRPGIFEKSQPDEGLVHSLEHGMIWVSYKSSIPAATKKKLEDLLGRERGVVLTVRDANDTDVAVAAWTRLDTFNLNPDGSFDEGRILDFVTRYRDKGPEYVPTMTGKEY